LGNQYENEYAPTFSAGGEVPNFNSVTKRYGPILLTSDRKAGSSMRPKRQYVEARTPQGDAYYYSTQQWQELYPNVDISKLGIYGDGGVVPNAMPNAELEKEEVTLAPDGTMNKFNLPSHAQATSENQLNLKGDTRVYSDSDELKTASGKTFAEEADKIRKEIMKYEQILYT
jgi:hypothetical protein